jgi:hypothetical protein
MAKYLISFPSVNRTPNFPPIRTLIFPPSVGVVVPSFISTS